MKPKIVIGLVIILAALGYLIISGFQETASYYMTISEVRADTNLKSTDGLRISGLVDTTTIEWDAEKIDLLFSLYEESDTIRVHYAGIMPDQLVEAQQVVVEGNLRQDNIFEAENILLKCPSKYETEKMGYE